MLFVDCLAPICPLVHRERILMPRKRLPFSGRTPVTLIHRLQEDRRDDWDTFCGIYGPLVHKLAEMYALHGPDADEVTAVVMKSLMERLRTGLRVEAEKGRFRNYVAKVTMRAVVAYRRQARKRWTTSIDHDSQPDVASIAATPPESLMRLEQRARVRLCLDRLRASPKIRKRNYLAFEEYVVHDEPAKAVAAKYGISCQRLYEIKREMLGRLEAMLRELDTEVGEV